MVIGKRVEFGRVTALELLYTVVSPAILVGRYCGY